MTGPVIAEAPFFCSAVTAQVCSCSAFASARLPSMSKVRDAIVISFSQAL